MEALQVEREESASDQRERAITRRRTVTFASREQRQERQRHRATEERHHSR